MDLPALIEFDKLARRDAEKYSRRRLLYPSVAGATGKHFVGIVGPRGAGKTILLKQLALDWPNTFFLSLDTFRDDLFETVKNLHANLKVRAFLLDEVHMHRKFDEALKKIHDFLDVRVVFTSSMALALHRATHDLSRRVLLKTLHPFSLREYLFFKHGSLPPELTIEDIVEGRADRTVMECAAYFGEYLRGGIMPFALDEPAVLPLLTNVLNTVIHRDIARTADISPGEVEMIEKLMTFIGRSGIDGINPTSISRNLGITKYKSEQYVELLEQAFVLHRVHPEGTGVLKEPKVVMAVPYRLLYRPWEEAVGGLREDFVVEAFKAAGHEIRYLKSTRGAKTPDYAVAAERGVVFEVGGKGKGRSQFKGFRAERKIILADGLSSTSMHRPLFLVGLLAQKSATRDIDLFT